MKIKLWALSLAGFFLTNVALADNSTPLGLLPETDLSYALLQDQSQYPAVVTVGGYLEADLQAWGGSNLTHVLGDYPNSGTALALTSANLYTLANINNWTQAFMTVDGGLNGQSTIISEALLNFGNLNKSPLYATVGKTYLPFGEFPGSGLVASSLDSSAFQSSEIDQLDLGLGKGGFNTTFAMFNGQSNFNDFAYDLQYTGNVEQFSLSGGVGYMNDVRYSGSGVGTAYGFIQTNFHPLPTTPVTGGRNGAIDLNAGISYNLSSTKSLGVAAEWDSTTTSPFFRGTPTGKLQAWTITGNYTTVLFNMNTTFALDYSATINMQFVPFPLAGAVNTSGESVIGAQNQWLGYAQSEVFKNIYLGPEFAWMRLYNGEHTWESTVDLSVYF